MESMTTHYGGCHCGNVRFQFKAPKHLSADRCNCSICSMSGFVEVLVPAERFHFEKGEQELSEYRFNTKTARHLFCRHCGVKSFYVPRSHPEGYAVNLNCIDSGTVEKVDIDDFDGQNWEANVAALRAQKP